MELKSNAAIIRSFRNQAEHSKERTFFANTSLLSLSSLLFPITFLLVVIFQPWVEAKWMFLDPLTAAQLSGDCCHTYYGFVSTLGIIMWATVASVSLFAAALLFAKGVRGRLFVFPLAAGLLSGWLMLDDAFMIHEVVAPSFGIQQNSVLLIYCLLAITYALASWRIIFNNDYVMFVLSGVLLVSSIAIDTVFHSLDPTLVLLEDSTKFLGIYCWVVFHLLAVSKLLLEPHYISATQQAGAVHAA